MRRIPVSADREYNVDIDVLFQPAIEELSKDRSRVGVFFSQSMESSIPKFESGDTEFFYFPIPDGEACKSAVTLQSSWNWLGAAGFTRSDLIIGIGGGAVTDFAGFVAATWLRGVDWIAVPTTIAGMVDAAIGGKTGINSDYGKNLVGAFYSPISVLIDPSWIETLSDRDFAAGLAEVIKCGFIKDEEILRILNGSTLEQVRASTEITLELIERSVRVKANVVSGDFKESFEREVLNYGHTFGHAVELHSKYSLRHGECVSIGLSFIAHLAVQVGVMSQELLAQHLAILRGMGLPTSYPHSHWPDLLASMKLDKKSRGNSLRFVVISEIGKTQRLENPNESDMIAAYEKVSQ